MLSTYASSSLSCTLALIVPVTAQSYYDAMLEPFFNSNIRQLRALKAVLPPALTAAALICGDALLACGLLAWSCRYVLTAMVVVALAANVLRRLRRNALGSKPGL